MLSTTWIIFHIDTLFMSLQNDAITFEFTYIFLSTTNYEFELQTHQLLFIGRN